MKQAHHTLRVPTRGKGLVDLTPQVRTWIASQGLFHGLLTVFCRHTSASLIIQENADPTVKSDLLAYFEQLAPEAPGRYDHDAEGPDDMPSHLRAALTQASLGIPLVDGKLVLGTWQALYLFEHRSAPHTRDVVLHLIGE